jgi:hypothetical protein
MTALLVEELWPQYRRFEGSDRSGAGASFTDDRPGSFNMEWDAFNDASEALDWSFDNSDSSGGESHGAGGGGD